MSLLFSNEALTSLAAWIYTDQSQLHIAPCIYRRIPALREPTSHVPKGVNVHVDSSYISKYRSLKRPTRVQTSSKYVL